MRPRVIPVMLLDGRRRLIKTRRFANEVYLGDPCNVIRIFNEKQVDEIVVLDIAATVEGRGPDFDIARELASECFMPLCWGGGITDVRQVERLLSLGIEKVSVNSAGTNSRVITDIAREFGSQSVVGSMDVARDGDHYEIRIGRARTVVGTDPVAYARRLVDAGAGEILLNAIERDGEQCGYNLPLVRAVSAAVPVPVIALGGAGSLNDLRDGVLAGASAVAAGAFFSFIGRLRAVLITYPSPNELDLLLGSIGGTAL